MGKAGRFACILTPMLLTLASLVCIVLLAAGGTKQSNAWISNLYLFRIDTRSIQTVDHINLVPGSLDDGLLKTGFTNNQELGLDDFYNAYLWNYCSGNVTTDGKWEVGYCAKPKSTFYFNIYEIFKLDSDASGKDGLTADEIPANVTKVNKAIKTISNVMVGLFAVGIVATVVTFVVGWFGLLSRWGSCVTTIFAAVSFFFILTASIMATALYATLKEGFNRGLKDFGAVATLNNKTLIVMWLGVGFAFGASLFWMFSTCCCSGRTSKVMGNNNNNRSGSTSYEKAPYTYERVATPYAPTSQIHAPGPQPGVGYEPYRHAGSQ